MYVFMQCVAEAVAAKGVRGLFEMVPGAAFLYDVAGEALRRLKDRKRIDHIRAEVLAAATASSDEARQVAERVAREVAGAGPVEDRIALEMYLTQLPGAVRQSLKRADDPAGRSVPADFALTDPADLLKRLPARLPRFRTGAALPGKPGWQLVELLGTGGFGEVWLARNPALSALKGAVKFGLDPQARERLLRHEGALVSRVMEQGRHPNVVQLLDAHLEGDAPWLMYEYVPGGDLGGLIHAWQNLPPAERVARAVAAVRTLAAAVGHFHRLTPPLVHRDLKPANVLVSSKFQVPSSGVDDGTHLEPGTRNVELKVADFGIGGVAAAAALAADASRRSGTGFLVSQLWGSHTPLYASPQQQRGEPPDPRDDVHALGVIAFQMLTGRLDATLGADYAKTLRRLGVPEPLVELLGDCAAHDPENRPADAADLAEKLAKVSEPVAAPEPVLVPDDTVVTACPQCTVQLRVKRGEPRPVRCGKCGLTFRPFIDPSPPRPAERPRPVARPAGRRDEDDDRPRGRRRRDDDEPRRESAFARQVRISGRRVALKLGCLVGVPVVVFAGVAVLAFTGRLFNWNVFSPPKPGAKIERVSSFKGVAGRAREFRYTPDGRRLLAMSEDGVVHLFDAGDGTTVLKVLTGVPGHQPALSPDGTRLAVAQAGRGVTVHDVAGDQPAEDLAGLEELAAAMAYSPDGRWLVAGGAGGTVLAWDVTAKGKQPKALVPAGDGGGAVSAVVFDPKRQSLAAAAGTRVRLWDAGDDWTGASRELDAGARVTALAFTADGGRVVVGCATGKLMSWATDKKAAAEPVVSKGDKLGPVVRVAGWYERGQLAAVDAAGGVWLWNAVAGGEAAQFSKDGHGRDPATGVRVVAFGADGGLMATGGDDRTALVWEMFFKRPQVRLVGHEAVVVGVAWSPDGKRLATADAGGTVIVWSVPEIRPGLGEVAEVR